MAEIKSDCGRFNLRHEENGLIRLDVHRDDKVRQCVVIRDASKLGIALGAMTLPDDLSNAAYAFFEAELADG